MVITYNKSQRNITAAKLIPSFRTFCIHSGTHTTNTNSITTLNYDNKHIGKIPKVNKTNHLTCDSKEFCKRVSVVLLSMRI